MGMENLKPYFGYYTKIIHNVFESKMNNMLKEVGLTSTQMDMLRYLTTCKSEKRIVKQKDLESYFHISNPTVSVMLDRLENKKLIRRIRSDEDRRVRYVEPTEEGEHLISNLFEEAKEMNEKMMEGLSDEEIEAGMHFLKYIMERLIGKENCQHAEDTCKTD